MVARSLGRLLKAWGASVVGPAATVEWSLTLVHTADRLDFAMLDINLQDAEVFPVADALIARGVPFAFTTGYEGAVIPERYRGAAILQKPYDPRELSTALLSRMG
jgi:hypothetical protein